jgi:non-ribosomal peptide synthase protein (TIGR01720 family)
LSYWKEKASGARLINEYGPTETVVGSVVHEVRGDEEGVWVAIGRPIANTRVYILDEGMELVAGGVKGELYIGGEGVGRGYLNRPELTAERFVPDEYSGEIGARLYRSGDICRYRSDWEMEYVGRRDNQVKVRGYRIELGEVEAALSSCEGVRQTVVITREDELGGKRLVAYVVSDSFVDSDNLRSALRAKLPDYMIPSAVVVLDEAPLTPNGKIDRKALPDPKLSVGKQEYAAPRTTIEETLTGIFAQVLRLDQVGTHDNFFAIGGDSILGIQIVFRARQAGLHFNVPQLFQYQTIAELAPMITAVSAILDDEELSGRDIPLTPIQHRFLEWDLPEIHHFNQSIVLEMQQKVNPSLLVEAFRHLFKHHDGLRLLFKRDKSCWRQEIASYDVDIPFSTKDLSMLSETEACFAIEKALALLQTTLNISEGPLVRVALFQCGNQTSDRLAIICHHLVIDGVSWRILLQDLELAISQLRRKGIIQLPPKTTSFKVWAHRLFDHAQSPEREKEKDFWLSQAFFNPPSLPVDFSEGANVESTSQTVSVSLSVEETHRLLHDVQSAFRAQINELLLTALVQAFSRWTGSRSLMIDMEGHGREEILPTMDLSRTVGWFTSIFPVVLELEGNIGPAEDLKSVKNQLRRIPNNGIGYGALRYLKRDGSDERLLKLAQPQVIFNYFGQLDLVLSESPLFKLAKESIGPSRSPLGQREHLLEINSSVIGGQFLSNWTYSKCIHQRATIENLAQDYLAALRSLIVTSQTIEEIRYTPIDFPKIKIDQEELDELLARVLISFEGDQ